MNILKKSKNKINFILNKRKTSNHLVSFFKEYEKKKSNGKKILIYAGIGHMYMSYFEILVYHLLIKEGYEVNYLIYDEHISVNEVITKEVVQKVGKDKFWKKSIKNATNLLNQAKVNFEFIDTQNEEVDYEMNLIAKDLESIYNYTKDGIALGNIVKGTMYRYYKSLTFDNDALDIAKQFLFTTLTNYFEIKKRCNTKVYDYVLFSHGIYVTWEPVAEFCKLNDIDFIAYDRAKTQNTININFNQVAPDWSFDTAWERYKNKNLSKIEKQNVKDYLKDRELQINDVYSYNFSNRSKDVIQLKKDLSIPSDKKIITIFTNLIWDAANVSRDLAFANAFECVTQTIEYYKKNKRVHVLLRPHPAEKIFGAKEKYGDMVRHFFNNKLPKNVTIIEPEMSINSFSIIDISDIGVVNTSTVGLEFALLSKPIVLISETHYRNKGFTYDVNSKEGYFEVLNTLIQNGSLKPNQVELAEKYFFLMMFKYQQQVPLLYNELGFSRYKYNTINDIPIDDNIYNIIKKLRNSKRDDFVNWE